MFLREMSDTHLEISPFFVPPMVGDEDTVLILSGDICTEHSMGAAVRQFFESVRRFKAVVYVPGNHEYYRSHLDIADLKIKEWLVSNGYDNVHFLNAGSVIIDDVAFIGATLWTDINKGNPLSSMEVEFGLNDYRVIRTAGYRRIRARDTICKHIAHKAFLFNEMERLRPEVRRTVIMSHHAPSELSVHPKYAGSGLNAAYYSDLYSDIASNGPDLWTHGHMHDNFDYTIGSTRVLCNPRGYAQMNDKVAFMDMLDMDPVDLDDPSSGDIMAKFQNVWHQENHNFNPFLRIEI